MGDGNLVTPALIKFGAMKVHISESLLLQSSFAKMFCLAVSINCGMIGGFIFPMLTVAIMAATIAFQNYPDIPFLLFICCFMAGIPSGVCPMPITLIALPCTLFFVGLEQTAPIFIASVTSYLVVVGSGVFHAIQSRAQARQSEIEADADEAQFSGFGLPKKEELI